MSQSVSRHWSSCSTFLLLFCATALTIQIPALAAQPQSDGVQATALTVSPTDDLFTILLRATPNNCTGTDDDSPLCDYPEIFTEDQLRQGWILLHVFAVIYFFVLLAILCNDYFLPTVECICEDLNLSKDVAAATFMATATSMPEFFTNMINTLVVKSDLGVGTIIGSLMFNTLGVAGLAAMAISKPVQLDWWPITRDCTIYTINTVVLLVLAFGNVISFTESCVMMVFLVIYYVVTFNNNKFMPVIRVFIEDKLNCCLSRRYDFTEPPENSAKAQLPIKKDPLNGDGLFIVSLPENGSTTSSTVNLMQTKSLTSIDDGAKAPSSKCFPLPRGKTLLMKCWWLYTFPIKFVLGCCIPNPLVCRKFYPVTFIMCIIGIGMNAFMIGWMLTAIGVTIRVPSFVMGLTFLAFGSATPETVSSIISLRKGENGIGVSNSLGANSLAILLSLGVPWFIKNCMIFYQTGEAGRVEIPGQSFEYSVIILFLCTVTLFMVLSFSGYRLTKRVGLGLIFIYGLLIAVQILIEMEVLFTRSLPV